MLVELQNGTATQKTVWQLLAELNTPSGKPVPWYLHEKSTTEVHTKTCTRMFVAAVFIPVNLGATKVSFSSGVDVMVHFMCLLDWSSGCPDLRLNLILGGSVRVFLDKVNI